MIPFRVLESSFTEIVKLILRLSWKSKGILGRNSSQNQNNGFINKATYVWSIDFLEEDAKVIQWGKDSFQ